MRNQIIITAIFAVFILTLASGEDRNGKENQTIRSILAVPADRLFPENPALRDMEEQTNLLSDLCQNWTAAETAEKRIRLLRFAVELGKYQSRSKRSRFRLSDGRIGEALLQALDDESQDIRSTASDLFENEFDTATVQRFGPRILEIVRKRKNTDAILLLGKTGMKEAELLLREDKAFSAASKRTTELALARLGNREYEAKFIGDFKSAKPQNQSLIAQDLAYIATESSCRTLAEELRTPEKVKAGAFYSLRVFIIDALSLAYPDEQVLRRPDPLALPKDDSYYQEIERWAEDTFHISWTVPRPPFFYTMGMPIKEPAAIR
jgi:hypothetical protein